jgi:hypothetical protein
MPISINRLVKPKTTVTSAIKPKSSLSKNLVSTESFIIEVIAIAMVLSVVHLVPNMALFFILKN